MGGWLMQGGCIVQTATDYHLLQHLPPLSLAIDIQMPILVFPVSLHDIPCFQEAVEPFLVIKPAYSNHAFTASIGISCTKMAGGIGNNLHIGNCSPVTGILRTEHHETVEAPYQSLVHLCTPAVYHSHQSVTAILKTEELAEVKLEHLAATVLYVGQERRL